MPASQSKAIVDKLLTGVSQKIMPQGYISEMILPEKSVAQYSGKIGKYGNEHLRIVTTLTGGRKEHARVETQTRSSDTYSLETHGLSDVVTKEDFHNVEKPFDARQDSTDLLTTMLWLGKEKGLADTLRSTSVMTQNSTLSGTARWSDFTNSDPLGDGITARKAVRAATGVRANTLILGPDVYDTLIYHPQILEKLGFKDNRAGLLSQTELARAFDVERVLVGDAVYNSAKQGQSDSIDDVWGTDAIFCLTASKPGLRQKTLGYRFQLSGQSPRQVYRGALQNPPGSEEIIVEDIYDQVLTDVTAGYLFKTAVA